MGVWIIGMAPDADIRDLKVRFTNALAMPSATDVAWSARGDADFIEDRDGCRTGTEDAIRFNELIFGTYVEELEDLWSEVMGFADGASGEGVFVASLPRGGPATALYYALGPDASGVLPGRFGDFLLTADEVAAALPGVEQALDLDGARRDRVIQRIGDWAEGMADPDRSFDPAELLDSPLRLFRRAATEGLGLVALSMCF